jgi:HSP20 family protein
MFNLKLKEEHAMTIVKKENYWPSFPSLVDGLFSRDLMDWNNANHSMTNTTLPAVNIRETDNEFQIEVAAPGMNKKDFKVNLEDNVMTISSERKSEKKEDTDNYKRREFSYQSFQRSFTIDEKLVNGEAISARYADGILFITLPKREEMKPKPPREIKIS